MTRAPHSLHASPASGADSFFCAGALARSLIKPMGDADMRIDVVEFGPGWERLGGASLTMRRSFFNPHDFAITPRHYIFFQVRRPAPSPCNVGLSCTPWRARADFSCLQVLAGQPALRGSMLSMGYMGCNRLL